VSRICYNQRCGPSHSTLVSRPPRTGPSINWKIAWACADPRSRGSAPRSQLGRPCAHHLPPQHRHWRGRAGHHRCLVLRVTGRTLAAGKPSRNSRTSDIASVGVSSNHCRSSTDVVKNLHHHSNDNRLPEQVVTESDESLQSHPTHGCLVPREFTPQTASQSVQQFSQGSRLCPTETDTQTMECQV